MIDLEKCKSIVYPEKILVKGDVVPYFFYEQFIELVKAVEDAKRIMKETVDLHDSEYGIPYEEEKWIKTYFPGVWK